MKTNYSFFTLLATLLISATSFGQITIAQWNFNGETTETVPGGAISPTTSILLVPEASASLVGGTTATFANGNTTAGTTETETTSPPNFGWNSTTYPASGTENKSRGVQFNVNTTNYVGITFRFEQRLSNTAANTYQVQYTTDASATTPVWVDAQQFTFTPAATGTGDTWYNDRTVNLQAVTALNDNPNAAFRVVSEFDPGTGNYLAARSTSTYAGGTVRYDMVTVIAQSSLGVAQFQPQSFKMYPNPTKSEIVNLSQPQNIEVYDILGKVVLKAQNTSTIDARSFRPGIYIVKTDKGVSRKLVVQ
ncbi:MAG: T9SS type A sorting domain-containing protein [Flavobacterium sp.]|uniref:T9SS type A sorting domain-containing protein n=1 Tax=Flavobacterium sp. TaxID=239 RepID=UPI00120ECE88|nr:T9SS type A sorting domain-containing protein [Flavobacterium sp.]RZJ65594.1 MAG: T9SS type A sorting domain-containing protein [Flavobacterium sp.]